MVRPPQLGRRPHERLPCNRARHLLRVLLATLREQPGDRRTALQILLQPVERALLKGESEHMRHDKRKVNLLILNKRENDRVGSGSGIYSLHIFDLTLVS